MTENTDKKISENPEVIEKASRRRFTAEYKRRIAIEAEACTQPGEMGSCFLGNSRTVFTPATS